MTTVVKLTMVKAVDEFGALKEQLGPLLKRYETLSTFIKMEGGPGAHKGKTFDAFVEERSKRYYKADLLRLNVDEATLKKCEATSEWLECNAVRRKPALQREQLTGTRNRATKVAHRAAAIASRMESRQ